MDPEKVLRKLLQKEADKVAPKEKLDEILKSIEEKRLEKMDNQWVAMVRPINPISGVAIQPEYAVGPLTEKELERLEEQLDGTNYHVDESIQMIDTEELEFLI